MKTVVSGKPPRRRRLQGDVDLERFTCRLETYDWN